WEVQNILEIIRERASCEGAAAVAILEEWDAVHGAGEFKPLEAVAEVHAKAGALLASSRCLSPCSRQQASEPELQGDEFVLYVNKTPRKSRPKRFELTAFGKANTQSRLKKPSRHRRSMRWQDIRKLPDGLVITNQRGHEAPKVIAEMSFKEYHRFLNAGQPFETESESSDAQEEATGSSRNRVKGE
ncbi:hypothetical protein BT69DRAFT_1275465, partial [Atractiella rhizophila]